jgi:hypothetical protein
VPIVLLKKSNTPFFDRPPNLAGDLCEESFRSLKILTGEEIRFKKNQTLKQNAIQAILCTLEAEP